MEGHAQRMSEVAAYLRSRQDGDYMDKDAAIHCDQAMHELIRQQSLIAELEARCAKYEADSMRLDKLQESFVKGEEFHIVLCEGKNDDEDCEHDTHPHFEAFDWSWRSSPVRASTLRDVIDKALAEGGEHG